MRIRKKFKQFHTLERKAIFPTERSLGYVWFPENLRKNVKERK